MLVEFLVGVLDWTAPVERRLRVELALDDLCPGQDQRRERESDQTRADGLPPPFLLRQAASNARRISDPAFSRSAAEAIRSSRSPVPRWPIPRMSREKPSSSSTVSGSTLR